jgi:hypothetical protein
MLQAERLGLLLSYKYCIAQHGCSSLLLNQHAKHKIWQNDKPQFDKLLLFDGLGRRALEVERPVMLLHDYDFSFPQMMKKTADE